eukprot:364999-Chlamydomonas_euryale.AAC.9
MNAPALKPHLQHGHKSPIFQQHAKYSHPTCPFPVSRTCPPFARKASIHGPTADGASQLILHASGALRNNQNIQCQHQNCTLFLVCAQRSTSVHTVALCALTHVAHRPCQPHALPPPNQHPPSISPRSPRSSAACASSAAAPTMPARRYIAHGCPSALLTTMRSSSVSRPPTPPLLLPPLPPPGRAGAAATRCSARNRRCSCASPNASKWSSTLVRYDPYAASSAGDARASRDSVPSATDACGRDRDPRCACSALSTSCRHPGCSKDTKSTAYRWDRPSDTAAAAAEGRNTGPVTMASASAAAPAVWLAPSAAEPEGPAAGAADAAVAAVAACLRAAAATASPPPPPGARAAAAVSASRATQQCGTSAPACAADSAQETHASAAAPSASRALSVTSACRGATGCAPSSAHRSTVRSWLALGIDATSASAAAAARWLLCTRQHARHAWWGGFA